MVEREIGHVQVKTSMVMEEGTRKDRRYEKKKNCLYCASRFYFLWGSIVSQNLKRNTSLFHEKYKILFGMVENTPMEQYLSVLKLKDLRI